jgi:hypothetical protein
VQARCRLRGVTLDSAAAADGTDHWLGRPLLSSLSFSFLKCAFLCFEIAQCWKRGAQQVKRLCGLREIWVAFLYPHKKLKKAELDDVANGREREREEWTGLRAGPVREAAFRPDSAETYLRGPIRRPFLSYSAQIKGQRPKPRRRLETPREPPMAHRAAVTARNNLR